MQFNFHIFTPQFCKCFVGEHDQESDMCVKALVRYANMFLVLTSTVDWLTWSNILKSFISVKELKKLEQAAVTKIIKDALEESKDKSVHCEDVHQYVDSQRRFHSRFETVEKCVLSVFEITFDQYQEGDSKWVNIVVSTICD